MKGQLFNMMLIIIVSFFILSFILIPLADKSSHWYIVTSGSMEPTLKIGDIVYVKNANPDEIKVGDIITFHHEKYIITHRCVGILQKENKTYFKTKGDANEDNDTFLTPEDALIGKVPYAKIFSHQLYAKVPRIGYLSYFVHTKLGFFLLVLLPGYTLIGMEAYNIFNILFNEPFTKNGYTLYKSKKRGIYYFAKKSEKGIPVPLPKGYEVVEKNGLLFLRKVAHNEGVIKCSCCNGIFYCEGIRKWDKIECVYCGNKWRIKC